MTVNAILWCFCYKYWVTGYLDNKLVPVEGTALTAWAGTEGMPLAIPESLFSVCPESLQEPELGEPELRPDDPEGMVLP
jgi:hypothetical protein